MLKIYLDGIKLGEVHSDSRTYCTDVYIGGEYNKTWSSQNKGSFWHTEVSKDFCRPFTEIFNCLYTTDSEEDIFSMLSEREAAIIDEVKSLPLDLISAVKFIVESLAFGTPLQGRVAIEKC